MANMTKAYLEPQELYEYTSKKGVAKATANLRYMLSLGFLGGAFISVGYLAYIRVAGTIPHEWGGLGTLLGAAVFPIGLICILVGGGELITSNMMAVTVAVFDKKLKPALLLKNLVIITLANLVGALFVAIGFQHLVANMFAIPAAMLEGANISVLQFIENMGIVFLGNFIGAVTLVAGLYTLAYKKKN